MTPSEIITQEAQRYGGNADIMLRKINRLIQGKAAILLQKNDSVLLLINIAKGVAELHLFTMDPPAKVADSLKYFVSKIRASNLKFVYGKSNEAQDAELQKTLQLLKSMGVDVQKSNIPRYTWMAPV
jgi:hypothetical protein